MKVEKDKKMKKEEKEVLRKNHEECKDEEYGKEYEGEEYEDEGFGDEEHGKEDEIKGGIDKEDKDGRGKRSSGAYATLQGSHNPSGWRNEQETNFGNDDEVAMTRKVSRNGMDVRSLKP